VFHLKAESITVVILAICIFLSFYFTFLSFQTVDDALKKQLVTLAASSLITGVIMLACITISLGIKKAFSRIEDQLKITEEPSEKDED
jgi:TRAP-type C4-dicarboxylate transport system permease small subunit